MSAYQDAINETSTEASPWHVIPADKKWYARLAISEIILERLKKLHLDFPTVADEEKSKLEETKTILLAE